MNSPLQHKTQEVRDAKGTQNAGSQSEWNLKTVIDALRTSREETHKIRHQGNIRELPSRDALIDVLQGLSAVLFPTHYGKTTLTDESIDYFVGDTLNTTIGVLTEQVRRSLLFTADHVEHPLHGDESLRQKASQITRDFIATLPAIRELLVSDLQAAFHGDPAGSVDRCHVPAPRGRPRHARRGDPQQWVGHDLALKGAAGRGRGLRSPRTCTDRAPALSLQLQGSSCQGSTSWRSRAAARLCSTAATWGNSRRPRGASS